MNNKKRVAWRYSFAFVLILAGILFNSLKYNNEFLGFATVGNWMIYVGFIMFAVVTLQFMNNKKRIVDERMEKIGYKASRITFLFIIFGAFVVMILDGVSKIESSYSMFMSYAICLVVLVYFVSYKILERYN